MLNPNDDDYIQKLTDLNTKQQDLALMFLSFSRTSCARPALLPREVIRTKPSTRFCLVLLFLKRFFLPFMIYLFRPRPDNWVDLVAQSRRASIRCFRAPVFLQNVTAARRRVAFLMQRTARATLFLTDRLLPWMPSYVTEVAGGSSLQTDQVLLWSRISRSNRAQYPSRILDSSTDLNGC